MPKINQEEYEVLKNLDDKWEWIARDEDGGLYVYTTTPHKGSVYWSNEDLMFVGIDDNLFQFIQWENQEPYNIAKLIEEYEIKELRLAPSGTVIVDSFNESEETEVKKDKEWLRAEVERLQVYGDSKVRLVEVLGLIDQLDEPEVTLDKAFEKVAESYSMTKEEVWRQLESFETRTGVLSQEWINDNNEMFLINDMSVNAVQDYKLRNLLVPKQELPVIPQFVADWIEKYREHESNVWHLMNNVNIQEDYNVELWTWLWSENNADVLARAWLDGFTVEEEPKYIVLNKSTMQMILHKVNDTINPTVTDLEYYTKTKNKCYEFTESEIKDYNKSYWPFAVKVGEEE